MDGPLKGHAPGPKSDVVIDNYQKVQAEQRIRSLQDLVQCKMIHSHLQWPSSITYNLWPEKIHHPSAIINENTCHCLNYTSTPINMFSKSKIDSNTRHWQPLVYPVYVPYAFACPFAEYQHFDKWK